MISSIITIIVCINGWIKENGELLLTMKYKILCILSIVILIIECWNLICYSCPKNHLKKIFPSDARYRFLIFAKIVKLFLKVLLIVAQIELLATVFVF